MWSLMTKSHSLFVCWNKLTVVRGGATMVGMTHEEFDGRRPIEWEIPEEEIPTPPGAKNSTSAFKILIRMS